MTHPTTMTDPQCQPGDTIWLAEVVEFTVVWVSHTMAFCRRRGGSADVITPIRLDNLGCDGLRHVQRVP